MTNMTEPEKVLAFVSFCIEEYKSQRRASGREVADLFEKFGVTDYLLEHYDILHSLSRGAILDDIAQFIANRNRKS